MMFIQLSTVIILVVVWCSSLTHRFDGSRTTTTSRCHNHQDYGGCLFVVSVTPITSPTTTTELRWSSSGGGLRAMIANIGYAHVFHKVGLFDSTLTDDTSQNTTNTTNTNTTTTSSSFYFSGISTNSGGTWFGVQFFYSPQFYNNVVTSNTTQTYQFILDWLQSYRDYLENVPLAPRNLFCRSLSLFRNEGLLDDISDVCDFLTYYGPSYPNLIRGMLLATSTHYNDPNLIYRLVNATNRVQPLQHTEYYIQNAIATNSKFTFPNTSTTTTTTNSNNGLFSILLNDWVAYQPNYYNYIGPYSNSTSIDPESSAVLYSVPLAVQYVIPNHGAPLYEYAIEPEHLPLQVYWSDTVTSPIGTSVQLDDWDDYPLYPPPSTSSIYVNTNTTKSKRRRRKIDQSQVLSPFFQGQTPSIVQMATASGSTFYPFASVPSILAQWYSVRSHGKRTFRQRLINRFLFNALGRMFTLRRDLALCSQWPDQLCGPTDTYFLDGGGGDGPCTCVTYLSSLALFLDLFCVLKVALNLSLTMVSHCLLLLPQLWQGILHNIKKIPIIH